MKSTVLCKDIAIDVGLFAFGGDSGNDDPPKIRDIPERKPKSSSNSVDPDDDDDDDDEDDYINDPKDRRIRKLSRESNRRRIANRTLRSQLQEKEEEIAELRGELKNAEKLQRSFEKLKNEHESQQNTVRRMAIRRAIESDAVEEGKPRSWYDVNMVEGLLKDEELSVDLNDFSVGGLKEQLDAIAAEKPFLVKASETPDDTKDRTPSDTYPSGSAPQSSATGNQDQQRSNEEAQMIRDFPALGQI